MEIQSRTQYLILVNTLCFIHIYLLQKEKKCFGPEFEPNGLPTVKMYGGHRTVRSDTVFSNRPYLHRIVRRITVRYRNYGQES